MTNYSRIEDFCAAIKSDSRQKTLVACTIHDERFPACKYWLAATTNSLHDQVTSINSIPVVAAVESRTYDSSSQAQGKQWAESICLEIQAQAAQEPVQLPLHRWIVIEPKPPTQIESFDQVPIVYWYILWDKFYQYLPQEVIKKFGGRGGGRYCHVIVVDPFYIDSTYHKDDLWCDKTLESTFTEYPHSFSPENLSERDKKMRKIITIDFAQTLHRKYSMAGEPACARAILIKRYLGNLLRQGKINEEDVDVGKRGDMLLLSLQASSEAKGFYWCKFGSPSKLCQENANAQNLRAQQNNLRPFLYVTHYGHDLPSDYIGILVSEPETEQNQDISQTKTLESFYVQLAKEERLSQLDLVIAQLSSFFDALHLEGNWKQTEEFLSPNRGIKYDFLLTSARCHYKEKVVPLHRESESTGDHIIEQIKPRDGWNPGSSQNPDDELVVISLKPRNDELSRQYGQLFLGWTAKDWRWQLWRSSLTEGSVVNLDKSVTKELPGTRIEKHLEFFRSLLSNENLRSRFNNYQPFPEQYNSLVRELQNFLEVEILPDPDHEVTLASAARSPALYPYPDERRDESRSGFVGFGSVLSLIYSLILC